MYFSPPFYLQFSGAFQCSFEGTTQSGNPFQKELSLLLLLALEPDQDHPRQLLSQWLWPAASSSAQRNNMRQTLSRLRKLLSAEGKITEALQITAQHISLARQADLETDIWQAESALEPGKPLAEASLTIITDYLTHRFSHYSLKRCDAFNVRLSQAQQQFEQRITAQLLAYLDSIDLQHHKDGKKQIESLCRNLIVLAPGKQQAHLNLLRVLLEERRLDEANQVYANAQRIFPEFRQQLSHRDIYSLSLQLDSPVKPGTQRQLPLSFLWISYCEEDFLNDDDSLNDLLDIIDTWFRERQYHVLRQVTGEMLIYHAASTHLDRATDQLLLTFWSMNQAHAITQKMAVLLHGGSIRVAGNLDPVNIMLLAHQASTLTIRQSLRCGLWMSEICRQRLSRSSDLLISSAQQDNLFRIYDIEQSTAISSLEYSSPLPELIGRDDEIQLFRQQWQRVLNNETGALLIIGEPGIGKSRFLTECCQQVSSDVNDTDLTLIKGQQQNNEPFGVFTDWLQREFIPPEVNDVSTWLSARFGWLKEKSACIAYLVQSEEPVVTRLAKQPAAYIHKEISKQLLALMHAITGHNQPAILAIEDMHWVDTDSIDVIRQLIQHPPNNTLILATSRPEFDTDSLNADLLRLQGLSSKHIEVLIRSKIADDVFPEYLLENATRRADGNPLFAEAISALLKEGNTDKRIPESLLELLVFRLNLLGEELLTVISAASVIGREFDVFSLSDLLDKPTSYLSELLQTASQYELLELRSNDRYLFKHYLIYQAAYELLDHSYRRTLHRRAAEYIEHGTLHPMQYRSLDAHWLKSGSPANAVKYRLLHCDRLIALSSYQEALDYNQQTLTYFESGELDNTEQHIDCLHKQGQLAMMLRGYGDPLIVEFSRKEIELARQTQNLRAEYFAQLVLWFTSSSRDGHEAAVDEALTLQQIAIALDDLPLQVQAHYCLANGYMFMGEFDKAEAACLWAIKHADDNYDSQVDHFGEHAVVLCLSFLAWIDQFRHNDLDAALKKFDRAILLAEEVDHSYSLAFAQGFRILLLAWTDRFDLVEKFLPSQRQLADDYHFAFWQVAGKLVNQLCLIRNGTVDDCQEIREQLDVILQIIPGHFVSFAILHIKALAILEDWEALKKHTSQLLAFADTKTDRYHLADLYYHLSLVPDANLKAESISKAQRWVTTVGSPHVANKLAALNITS
ncbi:AAA family ATPase [Pseudohongiella nitratireducens]|uniref:AAA family ATPase n=1 Tax=Pseudohongiella nitratireducens TaxID=1768907 RepID=UPI0030EBD0A3|tara:strand:- start:2096 stop:5677 length:3582 start_codon:yes stop_codon:yes gene_type:complete